MFNNVSHYKPKFVPFHFYYFSVEIMNNQTTMLLWSFLGCCHSMNISEMLSGDQRELSMVITALIQCNILGISVVELHRSSKYRYRLTK